MPASRSGSSSNKLTPEGDTWDWNFEDHCEKEVFAIREWRAPTPKMYARDLACIKAVQDICEPDGALTVFGSASSFSAGNLEKIEATKNNLVLQERLIAAYHDTYELLRIFAQSSSTASLSFGIGPGNMRASVRGMRFGQGYTEFTPEVPSNDSEAWPIIDDTLGIPLGEGKFLRRRVMGFTAAVIGNFERANLRAASRVAKRTCGYIANSFALRQLGLANHELHPFVATIGGFGTVYEILEVLDRLALDELDPELTRIFLHGASAVSVDDITYDPEAGTRFWDEVLSFFRGLRLTADEKASLHPDNLLALGEREKTLQEILDFEEDSEPDQARLAAETLPAVTALEGCEVEPAEPGEDVPTDMVDAWEKEAARVALAETTVCSDFDIDEPNVSDLFESLIQGDKRQEDPRRPRHPIDRNGKRFRRKGVDIRNHDPQKIAIDAYRGRLLIRQYTDGGDVSSFGFRGPQQGVAWNPRALSVIGSSDRNLQNDPIAQFLKAFIPELLEKSGSRPECTNTESTRGPVLLTNGLGGYMDAAHRGAKRANLSSLIFHLDHGARATGWRRTTRLDENFAQVSEGKGEGRQVAATTFTSVAMLFEEMAEHTRVLIAAPMDLHSAWLFFHHLVKSKQFRAPYANIPIIMVGKLPTMSADPDWRHFYSLSRHLTDFGTVPESRWKPVELDATSIGEPRRNVSQNGFVYLGVGAKFDMAVVERAAEWLAKQEFKNPKGRDQRDGGNGEQFQPDSSDKFTLATALLQGQPNLKDDPPF